MRYSDSTSHVSSFFDVTVLSGSSCESQILSRRVAEERLRNIHFVAWYEPVSDLTSAIYM